VPEHLEGRVAQAHRAHLAQVGAHDLDRLPLGVAVADLDMVAGRRLRVLVGQGVHRPDHSIGLEGGHQVGDRGRVPVALAEFDPRPDAQVGKASAAPVDLLEVGTDLQGTAEEAAMLVEGPAILRWHGSVVEGPRGQVDVFGERQSGQADGDGAGARGVHVSLRGVPGELAVDVRVAGSIR